MTSTKQKIVAVAMVLVALVALACTFPSVTRTIAVETMCFLAVHAGVEP
jgi:hypothetical protein